MTSTGSDPHRELKNAFGRYATGVTVVSCKGPGGEIAAMTVNSFSSVSLSPALVSWCIERRASSFAIFAGAENYAVSVLRHDQETASNDFARFGAAALDHHAHETWQTGAPLLADRLAGFDCAITARHEAGDHLILIGEVLRFDAKPGAPLLYFASQYAHGPTVG